MGSGRRAGCRSGRPPHPTRRETDERPAARLPARPEHRPAPRCLVRRCSSGTRAAARRDRRRRLRRPRRREGAARAPVDVTLIDRRNYHLFQPLLYQVATAALSPADIAQPIRAIVGRQRNAARAARPRHRRRRRRARGDRRRRAPLPYDQLVSRPARGTPISAMTSGRRRARPQEDRGRDADPRRDPARVRGGRGRPRTRRTPATAELRRGRRRPDRGRARRRDRRTRAPRGARATSATSTRARAGRAGRGRAAPAAALPEALGQVRQTALEAPGRRGPARHGRSPAAMRWRAVGDERIEARTVIWAAGVAASPAAKWLDAEPIAPAGSWSGPTSPCRTIPRSSSSATPRSRPARGAAAAGDRARRQADGRHAARAIRARSQAAGAGAVPLPPSRQPRHDRPQGRGRRLRPRPATGCLAWLLWGVAHIYFLIGFRNRLAVALDWFWAYLTFQRGARLITGSDQ